MSVPLGKYWRRGPWKNIDGVEFPTLEWVDWFNNRRLFESIGNIPPTEYDMLYWTGSDRTDTVGLKELSLHGTRGDSVSSSWAIWRTTCLICWPSPLSVKCRPGL